MKTLLSCTALALCITLFSNVNSYSQWSSAERITTADGFSLTSQSHQKNIASNGDNVHMVYYDQKDATPPFDPSTGYDVYYTRSLDNGSTFGDLQKLAVNALNPSIAVNGSVIHVVYDAKRDNGATREVYYRRSNDNGSTWSAEERLTVGVSIQTIPSIAVSGNNVYVSFYDNSLGNSEIFHIRSVDGGNTWSARTRISNSSGKSLSPCLSASGSKVYIVYLDSAGGNWGLYFSKSINSGQSFSSPVQINSKPRKNTTGIVVSYPSLAVSGSKLTVVFSQISDGFLRLRYITSDNDGGKWSGESQLVSSSSTQFSYQPSLTASGSTFHLAYAFACGYIYYNRSTNNGSSWGNPTSLTPQGSHCRPSIDASEDNVHVIYYNNSYFLPPPDSSTNTEIWYRRNTNGGFGIAGRPEEITQDQNCECNPDISTELKQNYPNPFNPSTLISYSIKTEGLVMLKVYDMLGREVRSLVNKHQSSGNYQVEFNASSLISGTYFYKLTAPGFSDIKRMILVK